MADLKMQQLTNAAPGATTDIVPFVRDPSGTPFDRNCTMQQLGDYIQKIGVVSRCRVYNNADITGLALNAAAQTLITYNSERYDTDNYHSTSSNTGRLTVPVTGLYLVNLTLEFNITTSPAPTRPWTVYGGIRLNGTTELAMGNVVGGGFAGSGGTLYGSTDLLVTVAVAYPATAGDYFDSCYYIASNAETSGTTCNLTANPQRSPEFGICLLGS